MMPEWKFYDGGTANNYELNLWQLVDDDGEIIEEYEEEDLPNIAEYWDISEGNETDSILIPKQEAR